MTTTAPQPDLRGQQLLFVTGRLAADLIRRVVAEASTQLGFTYDVEVLGISVAALMHVSWIRRKLTVNRPYDQIIFPGWVQGNLSDLEQQYGMPCRLGPKEALDLPAFLGGKQRQVELQAFHTEILAEINHAPRKSLDRVIREAEHYRDSGANVIDVGCIPGEGWSDVGKVVSELVQRGFRVSIDSFDELEVKAAVDAGAELVLSCASVNLHWTRELDVEWVVIPDDPRDISTMWRTADELQSSGRKVRIDPILEPVGFGFAASLARYFEARRQHPNVPMLMGIGNVTEMSEVDSAGVNFLLAAICEELQIESVLTTEVINWCRGSVREFDISRRMAHYAVQQQSLPKHLAAGLVMLRDLRVSELGDQVLTNMSRQIRDPNFRIFVERDEIHVINRDGYWRGTDAFDLYTQFSQATCVDSGHAFYLGYELAKAVTALTLGKQYVQDQSLNWGHLTRPEKTRHDDLH